MKRLLGSRVMKVLVFAACLVPLGWLAYRWETNDLGINRIETVARYTGDWTLNLLLATLAVSPLRRIPGLGELIRYRRMLGLFAFFYGSLHFLHYLALDKQWIWEIIFEDFRIRQFYIFGLVAYLCMLPLALTSYAAAIRWMGGKRWRWLHRLIYVSAIAGVVHYALQGKVLVLGPVQYGAVLAVLLGYRVVMGVWGLRRRVS